MCTSAWQGLDLTRKRSLLRLNALDAKLGWADLHEQPTRRSIFDDVHAFSTLSSMVRLSRESLQNHDMVGMQGAWAGKAEIHIWSGKAWHDVSRSQPIQEPSFAGKSL